MSSRMKAKQARRQLRKHTSPNKPKKVSQKFPNMERWHSSASARKFYKALRKEQRSQAAWKN